VSFSLTELEQTEEEDVRGRCKEADAEWVVRAGEPDAAIARLRGALPLPAKLGDRVAVKALAADEDSMYVGTATGFGSPPFKMARIDAATGELEWSEEIDQEPLALTLGDGAIWVTTEKRVLRVDADSGDTTETIDATSVAVAPDGAVWVRTEDEQDLRRLDPRTGRELERHEVGELFGFGPMLAAGADGVYTRVLVPNPAETGAANLDLLIRLDSATGEVTSSDATNEGGGVNQIEVADAALWLGTTTGIEQRDPVTLALRGANGDVYPAYGVAVADPGVWVANYGAVHAVDAADTRTAFTIPALGGPIAATEDTVWVHDDTFGLVRIAGG
jgi:outer membrane protein assembly factor BamB